MFQSEESFFVWSVLEEKKYPAKEEPMKGLSDQRWLCISSDRMVFLEVCRYLHVIRTIDPSESMNPSELLMICVDLARRLTPGKDCR